LGEIRKERIEASKEEVGGGRLRVTLLVVTAKSKKSEQSPSAHKVQKGEL
jgi:hypothetical protein